MFFNTLIISIILVAIVILALGLKMLFDKNAKFTSHTCALKEGNKSGEEVACSKCELKDLANCHEDAKALR